MNPYEVCFRTFKARGITFSKEQMHLFRIKSIINAVCCAEFFDETANQILADNMENNTVHLLAAKKIGIAYIISVIYFEDILGRNLFSIRDKDFYGDIEVLSTICN